MKHSGLHDSRTVVHCIIFPAANPCLIIYGDISTLFVKCSDKADSLLSLKLNFLDL